MVALYTTWFTSTADRQDHAVTDEAFAVGRGTAVAVCDAVVVFGPMEWPPQERCATCSSIIRRVQAVNPPARGVTRCGLFGWLSHNKHESPDRTGRHSPLERAERYPELPAGTGPASPVPAGFQAGAGPTSPAPVPNSVAPHHATVTPHPEHPAVMSPPDGGRAGLETPHLPKPRRLQVTPKAAR